MRVGFVLLQGHEILSVLGGGGFIGGFVGLAGGDSLHVGHNTLDKGGVVAATLQLCPEVGGVDVGKVVLFLGGRFCGGGNIQDAAGGGFGVLCKLTLPGLIFWGTSGSPRTSERRGYRRREFRQR